MLKSCLDFKEFQRYYAYKHYAYKKVTKIAYDVKQKANILNQSRTI